MIDFDVSVLLKLPALVAPQEMGSGPLAVMQLATDILRKTLAEVKVGEARYRFRRPITLTYYPYTSEGVGELIPEPGQSDPEGLGLTGQGKTFEEALDNWATRLHTHVQTLLSKRPWEMTEDEAKDMATVERMIDMPAHHRETPYFTRQIGMVTRRRPVPDRIQWEDGLVEHVNLHQMPVEFAAFVNGQRFEAITVRDTSNGHLQRVVFVGRLGRLATPKADRWEKTQTFKEIPEGSWDEID